MSHLILVRHGQSQWNLEKRFTGWVDVDLAPNGKLEACKAGELIKELKLNLVNQLTEPVRWVDSMNYIKKFNGIIIECGPGKVLSGLAKGNNINNNVYTTSSINFFEEIKKII